MNNSTGRNITENNLNNKSVNFYIIIFSTVAMYFITLNIPVTIRGDFIHQYFAYTQYEQGLSSSIENQRLIKIIDDELKINEVRLKWPPGPFIILKYVENILPISRAECLRLMGLIACIISSLYMFKIISLFTNNKRFLFYVSSILVLYPFITGLSYINFSNCDIFSISLFTLILYYCFVFIKSINTSHIVRLEEKKVALYILSFSLGSIIWFKKSTYIFCIAVIFYMLIYTITTYRLKGIRVCIITTLLFMAPLLVYENERIQNFFQEDILLKGNITSTSRLEKERDYYNSLLGEYHSNSTTPSQTLLGLLAGPAFFVFGNNTFHSICDLTSYTQIFKDMYSNFKINNTVFFVFITCIPATLLFILVYFKSVVRKNHLIRFCFLISLFTIIFFCFLSYQNKAFNYLINKDFRYKLPVAIITQFGLLYFVYISDFKKFKSILMHILLTYFFIFPSFTYTIYYYNHYKDNRNTSRNGFFTYENKTYLNPISEELINSLNQNFDSSDIVNIFVTEQKLDGYFYFIASEMTGNIASCSPHDLPEVLKRCKTFKRSHLFVDKDVLDENFKCYINSNFSNFKLHYASDFYFYHSS